MNISTLFENLISTLIGDTIATRLLALLLAELIGLLLVRAALKLTGANKINSYFVVIFVCVAIFTSLYILLESYPAFLQGGVL